MSKLVDNFYRKNAIKFLFYYKKCKKFLNEHDITYIFGNYQGYSLSHLFLTDKQIDLVNKMMLCFRAIVPYLDDESLKALTMMGGNL